jgi:hypothetical protein
MVDFDILLFSSLNCRLKNYKIILKRKKSQSSKELKLNINYLKASAYSNIKRSGIEVGRKILSITKEKINIELQEIFILIIEERALSLVKG